MVSTKFVNVGVEFSESKMAHPIQVFIEATSPMEPLRIIVAPTIKTFKTIKALKIGLHQRMTHFHFTGNRRAQKKEGLWCSDDDWLCLFVTLLFTVQFSVD